MTQRLAAPRLDRNTRSLKSLYKKKKKKKQLTLTAGHSHDQTCILPPVNAERHVSTQDPRSQYFKGSAAHAQ